jgi:hypothetical protein
MQALATPQASTPQGNDRIFHALQSLPHEPSENLRQRLVAHLTTVVARHMDEFLYVSSQATFSSSQGAVKANPRTSLFIEWFVAHAMPAKDGLPLEIVANLMHHKAVEFHRELTSPSEPTWSAGYGLDLAQPLKGSTLRDSPNQFVPSAYLKSLETLFGATLQTSKRTLFKGSSTPSQEERLLALSTELPLTREVKRWWIHQEGQALMAASCQTFDNEQTKITQWFFDRDTKARFSSTLNKAPSLRKQAFEDLEHHLSPGPMALPFLWFLAGDDHLTPEEQQQWAHLVLKTTASYIEHSKINPTSSRSPYFRDIVLLLEHATLVAPDSAAELRADLFAVVALNTKKSKFVQTWLSTRSEHLTWNAERLNQHQLPWAAIQDKLDSSLSSLATLLKSHLLETTWTSEASGASTAPVRHRF